MLFVTGEVSARMNIDRHIGEVDGGYDFVLAVPERTDTLKPLIIALHSRRAAGRDLGAVERSGTMDAIGSGMDVDAYVVAPQATGDRWDAERVMRVVDHILALCPIDTNRIFTIGMSMGANGVADLVAEYPDRIAAAVVIAGATSPANAAALSKVPLWVIRGLNDREGAIRHTDNMVEAIRAVDGSRVVYSRVKGLDHRQHEQLLFKQFIYDWLLSHDLRNPNRSVNTTQDLTVNSLFGK